MKHLLITGATGNVGVAVLAALTTHRNDFEIWEGVRETAPHPETHSQTVRLRSPQAVHFDFTDARTYVPALVNCDILFLLRPPQLSAVTRYFKPIIETCIAVGVQHIVFLSVQGVEKSSIIPHHQIEALIVASGIPYTFLRPAYFMQNFTTTLSNDLLNHQRIYLPAGNAAFTLVDVRDIGAVAATILTQTAAHINKTYALTCAERLTFQQMATLLTQHLGVLITFQSPNLFPFFMAKKKEKVPTMLIFVMIMLHYLPRFQAAPPMTDCIEQILGRPAITFAQFIEDNKKLLSTVK